MPQAAQNTTAYAEFLSPPLHDCGNAAGNGNLQGLCVPGNENISIFALKTPAAMLQWKCVRLRADFNSPETGFQWPYPGYICENPCIHASKGIVVIAGDIRFRIRQYRVPGFPDCSGALLYLIQPRGLPGLKEQRNCQISAPDFRKGIQQKGCCQEAGVQTSVVFLQ